MPSPFDRVCVGKQLESLPVVAEALAKGEIGYMTTPHHIEFWSRGGSSDLLNLLPLCYYHHQLVHEGGWQVVKAGEAVKFIPPDRVVATRVRGPGLRWAA